MNGVLLRRNNYDPPVEYPPLTVFVFSGAPGADEAVANAGRASIYMNSALEVSPALIRAWAGEGAPVALHLPLEGEELQQSLTNLGGATRRLAEGIFRHLYRLKEGGVRFRDVFLPSPCLHSILEEVDERPCLGPLLASQLERRVRGGWLSESPQTQWSQFEHEADTDQKGYLSYAQVYPPNDVHWNHSVTIEAPNPKIVRQAPTYSTLEAWIANLAEEGIRPVPVVAYSDDVGSWENAIRVIKAVEGAWGHIEPLALLNVNMPTKSYPVPKDWWTLGGHRPSLLLV